MKMENKAWTPIDLASTKSNEMNQTLCGVSPGFAAVQSAPDCSNLNKTSESGQGPIPYSGEIELDIVRKVPVGDDHFALVDAADLPLIEPHNWYPLISKANGVVYAMSTRSAKHGGGLMHRIIMGLPLGDPRKVDHRDGNGLNNTRDNLRVGSQSQNRANSTKRKAAQSQYKGVMRCGKKWRAQICAGKQRYLGVFSSEIAAALAYDSAALEKFGEFAKLNFPLPRPTERRAA